MRKINDDLNDLEDLQKDNGPEELEDLQRSELEELLKLVGSTTKFEDLTKQTEPDPALVRLKARLNEFKTTQRK